MRKSEKRTTRKNNRRHTRKNLGGTKSPTSLEIKSAADILISLGKDQISKTKRPRSSPSTRDSKRRARIQNIIYQVTQEKPKK
jgi:hypothetical protein